MTISTEDLVVQSAEDEGNLPLPLPLPVWVLKKKMQHSRSCTTHIHCCNNVTTKCWQLSYHQR